MLLCIFVTFEQPQQKFRWVKFNCLFHFRLEWNAYSIYLFVCIFFLFLLLFIFIYCLLYAYITVSNREQRYDLHTASATPSNCWITYGRNRLKKKSTRKSYYYWFWPDSFLREKKIERECVWEIKRQRERTERDFIMMPNERFNKFDIFIMEKDITSLVKSDDVLISSKHTFKSLIV